MVDALLDRVPCQLIGQVLQHHTKLEGQLSLSHGVAVSIDQIRPHLLNDLSEAVPCLRVIVPLAELLQV